MFCKHCGHKLTHTDTRCPGCGAPIDPASFGVQRFKVELPDHERELQQLLEKTDAKRAVRSLEIAEPEIVTLPENAGDAEDEATQPAQPPLTEDIFPVQPAPQEILDALQQSPAQQTPQTAQPQAVWTAKQKPYVAPHEAVLARIDPDETPYLDVSSHSEASLARMREEKQARSSRHLLTAVVCLCMVVLVALVAVRLKTHLFDSPNSSLEPVALTSLTDEEKSEVQTVLLRSLSLGRRGYRAKEFGVGAFFEALDLNEVDNLYAAAFGQPTPVTQQPDPLGRFSSQSGDYSYYRIAESELNALASRYGVSLPGSGNNSEYYYYDGAYYFRAATAEEGMTGGSRPDLQVTKAQRTEDGSYYIVLGDATGVPAYYALVSRSTDAAEEDPWDILEFSASPLFRDDGGRILTADGTLAFEMRHESIAAKANDGTVYANYVLDYPYFTDTANETAATVNALYAQMLASYKELAEEAEKHYQSYLKRDYDTKLLPNYTYMVSTVTCNKDGTLSLLDELTEYNAEASAKAQKAAAEEDGAAASAAFVMPAITYSGTTIDVASGTFLRRDDFFSEDFELYQTLLYRLFAGDDPETLAAALSAAPNAAASANEADMTEESASAASSAAAALPALDGTQAVIAQQIYASPWVLTENSVRFCYLGNGYYTYVTLPRSFLSEQGGTE